MEGFAAPPLGHAGSRDYEVGYRRFGKLSEGLLRTAPLEPKSVFTLH